MLRRKLRSTTTTYIEVSVNHMCTTAELVRAPECLCSKHVNAMGSARTASKVGEVAEDRQGERQRGRIWSGAVRWHGDKGRMTSWKPKARVSKGVACKTSRS